MKTLVISHNVFSNNENMGKTLLGLFSCFDPNNVFQLYTHSEIPTVKDACNSYYRITDTDAIKAIVKRNRPGTVFKNNEIKSDGITSRVDRGSLARVYQKGRKRTPFIYLARDLIWALSGWFSTDLKKWLKEIKPDIVFFATGDYCFSYVIAEKISNFLNIPLVLYCVDDYYFFNPNKKSILGKIRQALFMKQVKKLVRRSSAIITICDKMAVDYERYFHKPSYTVYTPADDVEIKYDNHMSKISYFGSLGVGRDDQIVNIGRAIKRSAKKTGISYIDVYSSENRPEVLKKLTQENGIRLHALVRKEEMHKIFRDCIAVVHTESFDQKYRQRVKYSISTKIAESLMYGPCIFAFGPMEVASIAYLSDNNAAFIVNDNSQLEDGIAELVHNSKLREEVIKNARQLASKNHDLQANYVKLKRIIEESIAGYKKAKG